MATISVNASYPLTVHNMEKSKVRPLIELGADRADSVGEAVEKADVVMTFLPGPTQVRGCPRRRRGTRASWLWQNLERAQHQQSDNLSGSRGRGRRVRNPLVGHTGIGSNEGSQAGTLTALNGGKQSVLAECKSIFNVIG